MNKFVRIAAALAVLSLAPAVQAETHPGHFAAAARASTLGAGVEVIYGLNDHFNLRGQMNFISLDRDLDEDGVNYKGKLDFQTFGVLADYHPFAGSFRISGGLFQNGNEIGLTASCPTGCDVGDLTITSTGGTPAHLDGGVDFNSTAPYLGLGWGNAMAGGAWHFGFDIGVLFQGSPKVTLAASGTADVRDNTMPAGPGNPRMGVDAGTDPAVQKAVADEEQSAQADLDEFKLYPVLSFTLGYRF